MARTFDPNTMSLRDVSDVLLISASAGTGKTWIITRLAARWLLEEDGRRPHQLLLVTFTRAAAAELKSRLRQQLVEIGDVVRAQIHGIDGPHSLGVHRTPDEWKELLNSRATADLLASLTLRDSLETIEQRLDVLSDLDDASAKTLHSFASQIVSRGEFTINDATSLHERSVTFALSRAATNERDALGALLGSPSTDVTPTETADALATKLREALDRAGPLGGTRLGKVSFGTFDSSDARLVEAHRLFLQAEETSQRLRQLENIVTYDDVMVNLYQESLHDGGALIERVRANFGLVLVDEFQDTDIVQWDTLTRLFRHGDNAVPVVVVGDPKQAIYGFRGGDVGVFQRVEAEVADSDRCFTYTLRENFRSHGGLLRQLNGLFVAGSNAGWNFSSSADSTSIDYVTVEPSAKHQNNKGQFEIRDLTRPPGADAVTQEITRRHVTNDVVATTLALLHDHPPGDIAILCRTGSFLHRVSRALHRAGIATATLKSTPVMESEAARQVRYLLWALCDPTNRRRTSLLYATWFTHLDAESFFELADLVERRGVSALQREVLNGPTMANVLRREQGLRHWTDLEHVISLVATALPGGVLPQRALEWLESEMTSASVDNEQAKRRIDSDEGVVRLLTIHAAKGLEFPVVLVPDIAGSSKQATRYVATWSNGQRRMIDPESLLTHQPTTNATYLAGEEAESRRLIYVALTRATTHLIAWISDLNAFPNPLGQAKSQWRTLVESLKDTTFSPGDPTCEGPTRIEVTPGRPIYRPRDANAITYVEPSLMPPIAERRRRWSYSTLHYDGSDPTSDKNADVIDSAYEGGSRSEVADDDTPLVSPIAFAGLRGPVLGNAVHEVMEHVVGSVSSSDGDQLRDVVAARLTRYRLVAQPTSSVVDDVVRDVQTALQHPLGPLFLNQSLDDYVGAPQRVASEMRFTLGIAPGETSLPRDRLRDIAEIAVNLDPSGPYREFFEQLRDAPCFEPRLYEGVLTGSIDLVARVGDDEPRFIIVDYKTNTLKQSATYSPSDLVPEMMASSYPLQALLYGVALHRYLRSRLANYDPAAHVGGVVYYYVRGPVETPDIVHAGLASWQPDATLFAAVSDLLSSKVAS